MKLFIFIIYEIYAASLFSYTINAFCNIQCPIYYHTIKYNNTIRRLRRTHVRLESK